jgi:hypothetical protein
MRPDTKRAFYFQADANSLGGVVEKPVPQLIPTQASVSLPPAGGHLTKRTGAFNHEEIISCRASYTRATGTEHQPGGPWSVSVTSVVEELNILEVVTAERIVAQISADYSREGGYPRITFAGSYFKNLRIAGFEAYPVLSSRLLQTRSGEQAAQAELTWPVLLDTGREQAGRLLGSIERDDRNPFQWITERFGWMNSDRAPEDNGCALCSLVDGVDQAIPGRSFGHVVEIPDFGRIFLAEVLFSRATVQLSMIRAELGCAHTAMATAGSGSVGGRTVPP